MDSPKRKNSNSEFSESKIQSDSKKEENEKSENFIIKNASIKNGKEEKTYTKNLNSNSMKGTFEAEGENKIDGINKIKNINIFPSFGFNGSINNKLMDSFDLFQKNNYTGINSNNINIINNKNNFSSLININNMNNIYNKNKNCNNKQLFNINSFESLQNNFNNNISIINNNNQNLNQIKFSNFNMPIFQEGNYFQNNITNINNINNINIENFIQNINTDLNSNFNKQNNNQIINNNFTFNGVEQILQKVNNKNEEYKNDSKPLNNNNLKNHKINPTSSLIFGRKKNGVKKNNNLFKGNQNLTKENKEKDIRDFKKFCEGLKCTLPDYICSQIGSRVMQKYLNRFPPFIITNLIEKIYINFEKMMCDIYGNYFCQKLYNISSTEQRRMILNSIKDIFINVSKTAAGAHVAQRIIEESYTKEEKSIIMSYIKSHEMELSLHPEGTHVLQKIIQVFPENERQNLTDVLCTNINVNILCQDLKGISVIKRLISFNTEKMNKMKLVDSFFRNFLEISKSSSGSYIIQYLLEQWGVDIAFNLIFFCITNFESFAVSKHSANLIDKIILICIKKYSIIRYFCNEQSMNIINNEIIIINALKNIILDPNKIINVYKNKYGKALIIKIRKLLSIEENERLYLFIKSLETVPNYLESKKYKMYIEIFRSQ